MPPRSKNTKIETPIKRYVGSCHGMTLQLLFDFYREYNDRNTEFEESLLN